MKQQQEQAYDQTPREFETHQAMRDLRQELFEAIMQVDKAGVQRDNLIKDEHEASKEMIMNAVTDKIQADLQAFHSFLQLEAQQRRL